MKRATEAIAANDDRLKTMSQAGTITLTREERYRRRIAWQTDQGDAFLLDLAEATYLPDGTGLLIDDGSFVVVKAAAEDVLEIAAPDTETLMRITWHIGNRHTPAEVTAEAIYILPDHVLADMVRGLGGIVTAVSRPFEPEGGAYGGHGSLERGHHHDGGGHTHAHHDHGHHEHDHGHAHPHQHSHETSDA